MTRTHTYTRTRTTTSVTARIRWEAAHRLPQLPGKCRSLHGHSWQAWVTVSGAVDNGEDGDGTVLDMSLIKDRVQTWVDANWDHATLLWIEDPLVERMAGVDGMRVFTFSGYPTVENVADVLRDIAVDLIESRHRPGVVVRRVVVAETENNRAEVGS